LMIFWISSSLSTRITNPNIWWSSSTLDVNFEILVFFWKIQQTPNRKVEKKKKKGKMKATR
jgi:hypothetical protein